MGGTVDPKTGEIVWDLNVPLEEQLSYYRSRPPRILRMFQAVAAEPIDHFFDGHGEPINSFFSIRCGCGCAEFNWKGVRREGQGDCVGPPVSIGCRACGRWIELFDGLRHGYDGELGHVGGYKPPAGIEVAGTCSSCGEVPHELIVRFEYASDVLGDDGFKDWKGREQDLFSWFSLVGRGADGHLATLFENECS